jgi:hypothetical protein
MLYRKIGGGGTPRKVLVHVLRIFADGTFRDSFQGDKNTHLRYTRILAARSDVTSTGAPSQPSHYLLKRKLLRIIRL